MSETRRIKIEIDGELREFEITEAPHDIEWLAGDPVPADKEMLGFVGRIDE